MASKNICLLAVAMLGAGCATQAGESPVGVHALRYRIEVTESGFALAHGVTTIIDEVFLPDYGVACNIEWTTTPEFERVPWRLRVFPATSERLSKADHVSDVFLPSRLAMSIVELASQQSALAKQVLALGLLLSEPSWGGVDQAVSK